MSAILEVENLEAWYGRTQALYGVSFAMELRGITTVLGANGAGKSTTLRAISGLVRKTGSISFAGRSIARKTPEAVARLGVAHVPQGRGIIGDLSVEDNLRLGAYTRRDRAAVKADTVGVLEREQLRHALPSPFSRVPRYASMTAGSACTSAGVPLAISRPKSSTCTRSQMPITKRM